MNKKEWIKFFQNECKKQLNEGLLGENMIEKVIDFNELNQKLSQLNMHIVNINFSIGKLVEKLHTQEEHIKILQSQVNNLNECPSKSDEELSITAHAEKIIEHLTALCDLALN